MQIKLLFVKKKKKKDVLDFIDPRMKRECLTLLPNPEKVESKNAIEAFRFLKRNITSPYDIA